MNVENLTRKDKITEILSKYRKAGKISIKAKTLAKNICKQGAKVYDIGEKIEAQIRKNGALLAFPVNISLNQEAAHYSPEILDKRIILENSIVKIDLGVHIDGYIVDTAVTVNHNPELQELTLASKEALEAAIEMIKPGVKVSDIGKRVENVINSYGYEPVRNLSGHQIKRYNLHAGVSIPNCGPKYLDGRSPKLEIGKIYAIEPFASTGDGWIHNGRAMNIFKYIKSPSKKDLRPIAAEVKKKVNLLPFSPRHLYEKSSGKEGKADVMGKIRKLIRAKVIMGYPVLEEANEKIMISQHEHTVRVTKSGCEVFTSDN